MKKGYFSVFITLLLVFPALAQVKQEVEPNDNREQAQEIRVGDRIEASIQKDNDNDWFKLIVGQPGKNYLQVDLSPIPDVDSYLSLLDAKGYQLVQINDAPKGEPESLTHFPVEPGVYYIRIHLSGKAAKENYTLAIKTAGPWQDGWESEPNDRREIANDLELGQSISGYFQREGDDDWYKLVNNSPGKTLVQIDLAAVSSVDEQLALYDEKGASLWFSNETQAGEPESIFNIALDQGISYVRVNGRTSDYANPYVLSTIILGPWREGMEAEPNNRQFHIIPLHEAEARPECRRLF